MKTTLVDYEAVFNWSFAHSLYGKALQPLGAYYDDERGLSVRKVIDGVPYVHDFVRFATDAMAFTSAGAAPWSLRHGQFVRDDWIHICVRLGGGGVEKVSSHGTIEQPGNACMVTRYPRHTEIERIANDGSWRVGCLWLKPGALSRLLELSRSAVPSGLSWLMDEAPCDEVRNVGVALTPRMQVAVNDMLSSPLTGGPRRAFMFARYLELATHIYTCLSQSLESPRRGVSLSAKDRLRIEEINRFLTNETESLPSLAELSRRAGINRTKLVTGFRTIYGTSVEAFWRDRKLQGAYDLLREGELSVGEVAFRAGYSETSSFSRAFLRRYGLAPKHVRLS